MRADYSLVYINFSLKRNFWRTCIDMALELGFMGLSTTIVTARLKRYGKYVHCMVYVYVSYDTRSFSGLS